MGRYFCSNCEANLLKQKGFRRNCDSWTCTKCGMLMINPKSDDSGRRFKDVRWSCDECGASLDKQPGFSDWFDSWTCTECGHVNPINEDEVYESEAAYQRSLCWEEDEYSDEDEYEENNDSCLESSYEESGYEDDAEDSADDEYDDSNDDYLYKHPHRCDWCNKLLNRQENYNENYNNCECERCGYLNYWSDDEDEEDDEELDDDSNVEENTSGDYERFSSTGGYHGHSLAYYRWHDFLHALKICGIVSLVILVFVGGFIAYYAIERTFFGLSTGFSSSNVPKLEYSELEERLSEIGFKFISTSEEFDLSFNDKDKIGIVSSVTIDEDTSYDEDDTFSRYARVKITYHELMKVNPPISSFMARGEDYLEIGKMFEDAGFGNIVYEADYDVGLGIFKTIDTVEEIKIDGNKKYETTRNYSVDSPIVIIYHASKDDKN